MTFNQRRRFHSWICQFIDIVCSIIAIMTYMLAYPHWGMTLRAYFIKRDIVRLKLERELKGIDK